MAAMNNAIALSEVATLTTSMNQGLRTAMDIMVRDMLQVGQGLPSGPDDRHPERYRGDGGQACRARRRVRRSRKMPKTWDS